MNVMPKEVVVSDAHHTADAATPFGNLHLEVVYTARHYKVTICKGEYVLSTIVSTFLLYRGAIQNTNKLLLA